MFFNLLLILLINFFKIKKQKLRCEGGGVLTGFWVSRLTAKRFDNFSEFLLRDSGTDKIPIFHFNNHKLTYPLVSLSCHEPNIYPLQEFLLAR